jgi:hypothetical protein
VFCPKLDAVSKVPYLHDHSVAKSQASRVVLGPKVKAGNIFWVGSSEVTVHSGAEMMGVLLVKTAVNFNTGSTLVSRILSQTAVTLQKASITEDPPRPEVEDV